MTSIAHSPHAAAREASEQEARDLFEQACHHELNITGQEFLQRLKEGTIPDTWPIEAVSRIEFLLPFARRH